MEVTKYDDIKKIFEIFFNQPNILIRHHYLSFNQFINEIIPDILINSSNVFYEIYDDNYIYSHGFICKNIKYKPVTYKDGNIEKLLFPKEARKKGLNYFSEVYMDVDQYVDKYNVISGEKERTILYESNPDEPFCVAKVPVMVGSSLCSTKVNNNLNGECKYDYGGYFIVNGKEKIVTCVESGIDNKPIVFSGKDNLYICKVNSKKTQWSEVTQSLIVKETKDKNRLINVVIPKLQEINIVILLRALGLETDKEIIYNCCYDLNDTNMVNLLKNSIDKAFDENENKILTQEQAYNFIINHKLKNSNYSTGDADRDRIRKERFLNKIIFTNLLPHLGDDKSLKIKYIGYMANKLFNVLLKRTEPDSRDDFTNKRIDTIGVSMGQLFRHYWKSLLIEITTKVRSKKSSDKRSDTMEDVRTRIKPNVIETHLKKALSTGVWGTHKSKNGIAIVLDRNSIFKYLSLARRVQAPKMDDSMGLISMRQVDNMQFGFLCPVESPEGKSVGIVKSLALSSTITIYNENQFDLITEIINVFDKCYHPDDVDISEIIHYGKIFINGAWLYVANIFDMHELYNLLRQNRRTGIIDKFTTFAFNYKMKEFHIYFDSGRLIRPVFIVENDSINLNDEKIKFINKLFEGGLKPTAWDTLLETYPDLFEYEDVESSRYLMIADTEQTIKENKIKKDNHNNNIDIVKINRHGDTKYVNYTHCNIHPYLNFGLTTSICPFVNHNFGHRSIVFFNQANQAFGIHMTSYKDRMDNTHVLYHPQTPITTTFGTYLTNTDKLAIGQNCVVALSCYMGYAQEDALILNKNSIDRGMFYGESVKKYEEEIKKNPSTSISQNDIFTKPDPNKTMNIKQANYSKLNDRGFIDEETPITNKDVIIGKISPTNPVGESQKIYKDNSTIFDNIVDGVIDRVHSDIYNEDGYEVINLKVRMQRVPIIGDKFCLTPDHEVLTLNGWKNINNIKLDDQVCCLDTEQNIYYSNPSKLWEFDHSGDMYSIDTQQVNLITTLNHKMYVKKRDRDNYELIEAKDIYGKRVTFKKNGNNNNKNIPIFKIPGTEKEFNMDDFLVFIGSFYSYGKLVEGSIDKIEFYFNDELFCQACNNMNIQLYDENKENYCFTTYYLQSEELYTYINNIFDKDTRTLPRWMFNLSHEQSNLLLTTLTNSPGFITDKLCDDILHLSLHCGFYVNNDKLRRNETNYEPEINVDNQEDEIINYEGKVYCIEVPDHVFYVRRNGIPVWTGNSNRSGQKGTVGILLEEKDMPFTEEGIVPDIIMNPHSLPTRMTVAQMMESVASKIGAIKGEYFDATPFNDYDARELPELLKELGFEENGYDTMYCGITGEKIKTKIFIGPTHYIRLNKMTMDKVHSRSHGPKHSLTKQPLDGRKNKGGLKIGEMEKDALVAHGMGQFAKEKLMECSDIDKFYVCDICGRLAYKMGDKNFYYCNGCNSSRVSAVSIPYAFKLLMQELESVNIGVRIKTENSEYTDNL